ncbi:MAG TPA: hypothetical protein VL856_04095 [Acidimicrobiia bacterium]|nr:hypothetical protein [Acidimicrobiia bacterium]
MYELGAAHYAAGVVATTGVIGALAWGAYWLRALLVPTWWGSSARLAEVTIALAALIGLAQLFGSVGLFYAGVMFAVYLGVGIGGGWAARARVRERGRVVVGREAKRSPTLEIAAACLGGALVGAQWVSHVAMAYGRGITQGDSLWYHATFAARFVESARVTGWHDTNLSALATPLHTMLPLNGSLMQSIAMLPFHDDFLSPVVNVGWAALAILAAMAFAQRRGTGALAVLGTILLLGVPTISGTQPGQAANDVATAALFLAAVALLLHGEFTPAPAALAAIAAGLALGTKLTVAAPIAVLTIGVIVVAVRLRRAAPALWWCGLLVLSGGFWFVRNWVIFGNPAPWSTVHLGPFTLTSSSQVTLRPGLAPALGSWTTWRRDIFPALHPSLGHLWPVVLELALMGAVIAIVRGPLIERFAGVAAIAGVVAVAYIQEGSDFGGAAFVFMVRYFVPSLMLGYVLLTRWLEGISPSWRAVAAGVMLLVIGVNLGTSYKYESAAWPTGEWIPAVIVVVIVAIVVTSFLVVRPRLNRRGLFSIAAAALAVLVLAGWALQSHYFDNRYVDAGLPHDAINAMFDNVKGEKVEILGTEHFYPFFGSDLSNDVGRTLVTGGLNAFDCTRWIKLFNDEHYRYIVIAHERFAVGIPNEGWVSRDPAAVPIGHAGSATAYRIDGPLDPRTCVQPASPTSP